MRVRTIQNNKNKNRKVSIFKKIVRNKDKNKKIKRNNKYKKI